MGPRLASIRTAFGCLDRTPVELIIRGALIMAYIIRLGWWAPRLRILFHSYNLPLHLAFIPIPLIITRATFAAAFLGHLVYFCVPPALLKTSSQLVTSGLVLLTFLS